MHDERFIAELFRREYAVLFKLAYRLTGDSWLAQDLVQETFLLAVTHFNALADHPSPGGWLTKTLYYLVKNERRRVARHPEIPLHEAIGLPEHEHATLEDLLPIKLPDADREILLWRFQLGLDYPEIANRLGISETAARMRISRAVQKCRKILRPEDFDGT